MGGRGIVLVGLLGTPGTARGGGVSESIAKAPRRANGTRGPWCRSSRTTPDAETCTSPSSVQFQPSFSSAKYTSRRRGGPTTAAVNRGDDRPGASPVIRREGLTVYYASSPSTTPPFLVQWTWGQVVFAPLMMSLIFSAGVCPFKTRRGRRLRRSWTAWTWASVTSVKLVPLGKYSRISPPVFSLVGR